MFIEDSWTDSMVVPLLAASCLWAILRIVASLPSKPLRACARNRARLRAPFTSVVSCAATLLTTPPAFSADQAPSPRRSVEPPWSRTSGLPLFARSSRPGQSSRRRTTTELSTSTDSERAPPTGPFNNRTRPSPDVDVKDEGREPFSSPATSSRNSSRPQHSPSSRALRAPLPHPTAAGATRWPRGTLCGPSPGGFSTPTILAASPATGLASIAPTAALSERLPTSSGPGGCSRCRRNAIEVRRCTRPQRCPSPIILQVVARLGPGSAASTDQAMTCQDDHR